MAEFALGLAKTAVAGTVSRVKSAIEEETKLRVRVEDDLVFITAEFEMMQSFLSASSTGDQASKNMVVRTWVRQLRGLAFDVEDCVEFIVHLDKPSHWEWMRRLALPVRVCLGKPPLPLDLAAGEIKRLKARVEDASQRNTRYNFITGDSSPPDAHHHELTPYTNNGGSKTSSGALQALLDVWKTAGRLGGHGAINLEKLIDSHVSELQVISLWRVGSADMSDDAPTSLSNYAHTMNKVYNDPVMCQQFENRAWVKLSALHPFNPAEFLSNLLNQFRSRHRHHKGDDDGRRNHSNANSTISELLQQLSELRYLVVIDHELNTIADWDAIRWYLPDGKNGSRVVVSTSSLAIARVCTGDTYQVSELQRFSHDRGLYAIFPKEQGPLGDRGNVKEEEAGDCELVGRHRSEFLFGPYGPRCSTISLWGIAGVGKTAVGRRAYLGCRDDYVMHGWVDVYYPFDLTELCRRLLLDFYSHDIGAMESAAISMTEGQDPIQWCCQILRTSKCILVIDGLRSTHDWDMLKATLLSQPTSGKTVVITHEERIATYCTEEREGATLNVTCLKDDEALHLFEKIAFEGKKLSQLDPEIEKSSKLLVSKCGGLPEVIVAVGKSVHGYLTLMELLNYDFIRTLQTYSFYTSLRGLFRWMHSYFDALPDELKPCIFYMLVFPADQSIRWKRLLNRWISEGYLPGGTGTMEEKGKKLLLKLMKLSILYSEQEEQISSCKVNGFFREYIKSSPMEDNLVFALEEESRSTSSRLTAGQHLTIRESWKRDSYEFSMMEVSRLRSLTVFGVWKSFLISDKMKVLRVLDLEGTSTTLGTSVTDNDLEEIVKQFPRLKFLSVRGCIHITRLPDSLGEMRQLMTLDVRYTSIVQLPSSITKLQKLQYISAGTDQSTDTTVLLLQAKPPTPPKQAPPTPHPSPRPTPQEDGHAHTSPFVRGAAAVAAAAAAAANVVSTKEAWKRKVDELVESSRTNWWKLKNKQNLRSRRHLYENGGGVEVFGAAVEGIGRLRHLHTLGVVNVAGGKCGLVFLKELKKLAQLRKLRLSGINGGNWSKLCDAIRGEPGVPVIPYLESLSLKLMLLEADGGSYEFACFDDHFQPPESLKRFKILYTTEGQVASIGPAWINKLPNLKKFNHELTISTQEDIHAMREIPAVAGGWPIHIKPTVEDLSLEGMHVRFRSLRVECSSNLSHSKVTFGEDLHLNLRAICIHCCCSPSAGTSNTAGSTSCGLEIAGLDQLYGLEQVTVTGTYADDLKRDLRVQTEELELMTISRRQHGIGNPCDQ